MQSEPQEERPPNGRGRAAVALALAALLLLALVLFRTQVLDSSDDRVMARDHRLRAVPLPAPRGPILDRAGAVLAGSDVAFALILLPAAPDTLRRTLRQLAPLVGLEPAGVRALERRLTPARPLVVASDLSFEQVSAVEERRYALPRVLIEEWPVRRYPIGRAGTSVIGRVAQDSTGGDAAGTLAGTWIGSSGLEAAFDALLRGEAGVRFVEVDAAGRIVRGAAGAPTSQPVAGDTLRTTIDAPLQQFVAGLLPDSARGAFVVLEPASGAVLALHSSPADSADPAAPAGRGVVASRHAPGSLFQPITAVAALEAGVLHAERAAPVPCRGGFRYGNRYFRCWSPRGHGRVDLTGALRAGCDVYFYQLGLRLGLDALLDAGSRYGLGRATGLELPAEQASTFPSDAAWFREHTGWDAGPADVLEIAGGRGPVALTLIRLAHFNAVLASGGAAPPPRLVGPVSRAPWRVAEDASLDDVLRAMEAPVAPGAAGAAAAVGPWRVRGQLARWRPDRTRSRGTSWFVGSAADTAAGRSIVIAARVADAAREDVAARHAGRIADYYLRRTSVSVEPMDP